MRSSDGLNNMPGLTSSQREALPDLRRRLFDQFDITAVVVYGSVARGEADEESDLDLLVITAKPLPRHSRHKITDTVFDVNLQYDTNFSALVVDRDSWDEGPFSVLPLHEEILREGIPL